MKGDILTTSAEAIRSLDVFHQTLCELMQERGLLRIVDEKEAPAP